ncbi:MAG: hypothetical protein KY468_17120 [Armatimonadetes bacterium]|nr:hypothetical protein [Armatimonadota bacterium]
MRLPDPTGMDGPEALPAPARGRGGGWSSYGSERRRAADARDFRQSVAGRVVVWPPPSPAYGRQEGLEMRIETRLGQ